MNLLEKIEQTRQAYDSLGVARQEKIKIIQKEQNDISAIELEMKKIEGSFTTLVQLAQEEGLIDSEGNIIEKESEENGNHTEVNSSSKQES